MTKPIVFSVVLLALVSCGQKKQPAPEVLPPQEEVAPEQPDGTATSDSLPTETVAEAEKELETVDATPKKETMTKPAKPTLHGSWTLEKIYGAKEPFKMLFPGKVPTVTFDLKANTLNGNNGCNQYNGPFTLRNGVLSIGDMMATKMFCEGVKEQLFMTTLKMANGYKFEGTTLVLTLDNEGLMAFKPGK